MAGTLTGSLQVDLKRRTTLPADILTAAAIPPGSPLVARVTEPGRIVLESPALLLALLQDDIATALTHTSASHGDSPDAPEDQSDGQSRSAPSPTRDLVTELLTDHATDTALASEQVKDVDERASTVEPPWEGGDHNGSATGLQAPRDGAA